MKLSKRWRQLARTMMARPTTQSAFRALYRFSLVGMNYGGAGSEATSGDDVALALLQARRLVEPIVFDVGANEGGYLVRVLDAASNARVYSFEPSRKAFQQLESAFGRRTNVTLVNRGVAARSSTALLYAETPGSVLATTFAPPGGRIAGEPISMVSIDEFCRDQNIERIDLLKIDVEGGELEVLRGATQMLNAGGVASIQFEFGQPSLGSRTYLKDLFDLLHPHYRIYRVLPHGRVELASYHETLEVFMSTNYLALKE